MKSNKFRFRLKLITLALASQLAVANAAYSESFHPQATDLNLLWKVIDHTVGADIFLGSLTITNNGTEALGDRDWALYYSSVRPPASVLPENDPKGIAARQQLADQKVVIANADDAKSGDYFVLKPMEGFNPING